MSETFLYFVNSNFYDYWSHITANSRFFSNAPSGAFGVCKCRVATVVLYPHPRVGVYMEVPSLLSLLSLNSVRENSD